MAHSGGSNTTQTPAIDPLSDVLYVDFFKDEAFGRIQPYFRRKYPDLAPMIATFIDPLGNVTYVTMEAIANTYYFTEGWHHFGLSYGIIEGAMVRLVYARPNTFNITIRDYKGLEWIYPPFLESHDLEHDPNYVPPQYHGYELLLPNRNEFIFQTVQYLSFSAYTGDTIVISDAFALHALPKEDGYLCIVDEHGKRWPCQVQHRNRETEKVIVTRGWARFCRNKGFIHNQKIMFAVTEGNSNTMFYLPMA